MEEWEYTKEQKEKMAKQFLNLEKEDLIKFIIESYECSETPFDVAYNMNQHQLNLNMSIKSLKKTINLQ